MDRSKHLTYGVVFVALLVGAAWGVVALYRGDLRSTVDVTVVTDRAGLTMDTGAVVKLRGVEVGEVSEVRTTDDGAELALRIDADRAHLVPAAVTVQIVPPTAFGAKYVQLTAPEPEGGTAGGPAGGTAGPATDEATDEPLREGQVLVADAVTVEVNEAFTNLTTVLDAARPSEVNNALTAVAGALDGRGEQLGDLVTQLDGYLASFNPRLPTLAEDLRRVTPVLRTYETALPDLVGTLDQLAVTGRTLTSQQASLRAFTMSLTAFADEAEPVVARNQEGVRQTLDLLEPVSALLEEYSPELGCVVLGAVSANELAENAVGGTNPGITTNTRLQPGDAPYVFPDDLPVVGETSGPACYGLPYVTPEEAAVPNPRFDVGTNPYPDGPQTPAEDLSTTLFGLLAGLVNVP